MNCVYFANVVIDPGDIAEREPVWAEAGRLRAMEMLGVLSESSLFQRIYLVSQGRGRKRKRYRARVVDKNNYTAVYLPILSYGTALRNLSTVVLATIWLLRHVRKADVVITYNMDPTKAIPILLTLPILRFKWIVQFEELYRGLGLRYRLHRVFERLGAKRADGFVVSNRGVVDRLQLDASSDRLAVASGYVPAYRDGNDSSRSRRNETLTLLYAGNLDETRGIMRFIQSFLRIHCDARLVVTGKGTMENRIRDLAGARRDIEYLGMLPEKEFSDVIADADVCVNPQPADHEFTESSFPSKVVNYLAHGKVVVSTRSEALLASPYRDMIVFYDDANDESLRSVLDRVIRERASLSALAREYPHRVAEIKKTETAGVLRVLRQVSGDEGN